VTGAPSLEATGSPPLKGRSSPTLPILDTPTRDQIQTTLHGASPVKLETKTSTAHHPSSLLSLGKVKEEAPPLDAHTPIPTNLLAPPIVKPGEPYYGDGSCQVEEEIPPNLQLEDSYRYNQRHYSRILTEQWAKRKMTRHNTSLIASWRSTSTSSSKSDRGKRTRSTLNESSTKGWISCSRRSRMLRRMPNPDLQPMVHPSLQHTWSTRPSHRLMFPGFGLFSVQYSCRIATYNDLDFFSYYIYTVSVMLVLLIVCLSRKRHYRVCIFLLMQTHCNFGVNCNFGVKIQMDMAMPEQQEATCVGFPLVATQVADTCLCTVYG
jgi:hypothetical protein